MKTNAVKQTAEQDELTYMQELFVMAGGLGASLDAYHASPANGSAPEATRDMVEGFYHFFETMLPGATDEMLDALTNLCAVETGRYRLEQQTDSGKLPGARILGVPGAEQ